MPLHVGRRPQRIPLFHVEPLPHLRRGFRDRCPRGHLLPHRLVWGRCSPQDCCDPETTARTRERQLGKDETKAYQDAVALTPRGLEGLAITQEGSPEEAARVMARQEEALAVLRAVGIMEARQAIHPMPDLPPPPDLRTVGPRAYVQQRLEDVAPLALERKIYLARFHPGLVGDQAAEELLDRSGHGRRQEGQPDLRGPVVFVNIGGALPYEAQAAITANKSSKGKVVNVQLQPAQAQQQWTDGDRGWRSSGAPSGSGSGDGGDPALGGDQGPGGDDGQSE